MKTLIRLALAGDARATFPGGEGLGKRIVTGIPVSTHSLRNPIYMQKSPMPFSDGIGDFLVCVTA